jgi:predicted transcriptional regulator
MQAMISKNDAMRNLAANVGRLMESRNVNQTQLGDSAEISQGYVCKILAGKVLPNALTVRQIAEFLGSTTEKLLDFPRKKAS